MTNQRCPQIMRWVHQNYHQLISIGNIHVHCILFFLLWSLIMLVFACGNYFGKFASGKLHYLLHSFWLIIPVGLKNNVSVQIWVTGISTFHFYLSIHILWCADKDFIYMMVASPLVNGLFHGLFCADICAWSFLDVSSGQPPPLPHLCQTWPRGISVLVGVLLPHSLSSRFRFHCKLSTRWMFGLWLYENYATV